MMSTNFLHLKQTFPPIIWIFTEGEGDGIKSRLHFKIFSTLAQWFGRVKFWILMICFDFEVGNVSENAFHLLLVKFYYCKIPCKDVKVICIWSLFDTRKCIHLFVQRAFKWLLKVGKSWKQNLKFSHTPKVPKPSKM